MMKPQQKSINHLLIARLALLALSVSFIIAGLLLKEHIEVLQKAVKVCLECIGIG